MTKSRIFILLFVVVSTVVLYLLPRYVVSNESQPVNEASAENADTHDGDLPGVEAHNHSKPIPESIALAIEKYYDSYINAENQEKRFIFADSLAKSYKTVGKLDSLAKYTEVRAKEDPSLENLIIAGDGYYEAFNFAVDESKRSFLAKKAQDYYIRVLNEDSSLLDIKSKLAMTYIVGSNPMQGIMMLREVLETDPTNKLAIYNLGMLSISSGQYDKAIERFKELKRLDPENPEASFYIGYCLFESGKVEDSKPYFEKIMEMGISGDLTDASEEYLKRINNN